MTDGNWTIFEQELLLYATNNMVKISVFIESPYVTVYETTEVRFAYNFVVVEFTLFCAR